MQLVGVVVTMNSAYGNIRMENGERRMENEVVGIGWAESKADIMMQLKERRAEDQAVKFIDKKRREATIIAVFCRE